MRLFPNLLLFVLGGSPITSAWAAPCEPAEVMLLSDEMNSLAARGAWKGVEQRYRDVEPCATSADVHRLGAEAARMLGDTVERVRRLQLAREHGDADDLVLEVARISADYGRVAIDGDERRPPHLEPELWPFAPDEREAILFADEALQRTGSFDGLLPVGSYGLSDGTRFSVEPGPSRQIVEAGPAPGVAAGLPWHGPVLHLGTSFLSSPQPASPTTWVDGSVQFEPDTVAFAVGGSVGVGYELGLSKVFGFAPSVSASTVLGRHDLQVVRGALLFVAREHRARLAIGPTWGVVSGSGTGVASWYAAGVVPEVEQQLIGYRGLSWGPGLEASAGWEVWDLKKGVALVDLAGAVQNDGERPYLSWGVRVGWAPKTDKRRATSSGVELSGR